MDSPTHPSPAIDTEAGSQVKRQVYTMSRLFVRLRWLVGSTLVLGAFLGPRLGYTLEPWAIAGLGVFVLLANVLFHVWSGRLDPEEVRGLKLMTFSTVQIAVDWVALAALVHYTGGIDSPCLYFFFLHLVISAILQPVRTVYITVTGGLLLLTLVFLAESMTWLPRHLITDPGGTVGPKSLTYMLAHLGIYTGMVYAIVYFASWLSENLREKMRQLSETKARLEESSRQLRAIYKVMQHIGVNLDLDNLLNTVVTQATRLWGIQSAFIALYDSAERQFRFTAIQGLDTAAAPADPAFLTQPFFADRLLRGQTLIVRDLRDAPDVSSLPCLQWLLNQNQHSLILVPLAIGGRTLGVFGLASARSERFSLDDGKYFRIFCDLVSVEIESARLNQLLTRHSRERTAFYRRAAHDLRAPLSAIRSQFSLVTEGYVTDPEKVKELVGKADARAAQLSHMVNDLLLLAENRMEDLKADLAPQDLAPILRAVKDLYEAEATRKGLDFRFDLPERLLARVRATRDGLERIFSNLVSNAIKYTPAGEVAVTMEEEGRDRVAVTIRDSGIGIPKPSQDHLFEEFFRAPNAKKLTELGTGLGLSITRQLVTDFEGTIEVTSEENRGTSFTVRLPVVREA